MHKADLIKSVSKQTGIERADVQHIVDVFLTTVKKKVNIGEKITLRGFCTIINKKHGPKKVMDIKRRKPMLMPAYSRPHFKPSKELWHTT